jgi:hypothetical protein
VDAADGGIGVIAAAGFEADLKPLSRILNEEEGLPIRPEDLVAGARA